MLRGAAGDNPALPFDQVWCVDFEFQHDGQKPVPVCMVAHELYSKREIRLWRDQLLQLSAAPFDTGPNSCLVAFAAEAELTCFLALGWPLPHHVLDLFQEHKLAINIGKRAKDKKNGGIGWGLSDALRLHGLIHLIQDEKPEMIDLILGKLYHNASEQSRILDYCATDVAGLIGLLPKMLPTIDLGPAIGIRGRYMKAVARMVHHGVPFDTDLFQRITHTLPLIRPQLIEAGDAVTQCYRNGSFNHELFEAFLQREHLDWERTAKGQASLDKDYLKKRAEADPDRLRDFLELRVTLASMIDRSKAKNRKDRDKRLQPSSDGMIRCLLWPFGAATGRNAPKASQFIFGPACWMRGFIKPPPGYAIAYIDWSAQEIALAGGLSGDPNLIADYEGGDLYWTFGQAAGRIPAWAVRHEVNDPKRKAEFEKVRKACKAVVLGIAYGKGVEAIARDANLSRSLANTLYQEHKRRYAVFWRWMDDVLATARLRDHSIRNRWGWKQIIAYDTTDRTLMNFHMQGGGAIMMQLAAIRATEQGIGVCCPVHDAFLIMAPIDHIDADVVKMQTIMRDVSIQVCGIAAKTGMDEDSIVRYPNRYMDERGVSMWNKINRLVKEYEQCLDTPTQMVNGHQSSESIPKPANESLGKITMTANHILTVPPDHDRPPEPAPSASSRPRKSTGPIFHVESGSSDSACYQDRYPC